MHTGLAVIERTIKEILSNRKSEDLHAGGQVDDLEVNDEAQPELELACSKAIVHHTSELEIAVAYTSSSWRKKKKSFGT